ncbi:hypothetical protein BGZ60DRAFT_434018 [Tricladium varicosporioides]|nr:hypothetical protein BGZ60DRAFT_434018 [Hymenoscyphus varicosporioides]
MVQISRILLPLLPAAGAVSAQQAVDLSGISMGDVSFSGDGCATDNEITFGLFKALYAPNQITLEAGPRLRMNGNLSTAAPFINRSCKVVFNIKFPNTLQLAPVHSYFEDIMFLDSKTNIIHSLTYSINDNITYSVGHEFVGPQPYGSYAPPNFNTTTKPDDLKWTKCGGPATVIFANSATMRSFTVKKRSGGSVLETRDPYPNDFWTAYEGIALQVIALVDSVFHQRLRP